MYFGSSAAVVTAPISQDFHQRSRKSLLKPILMDSSVSRFESTAAKTYLENHCYKPIFFVLSADSSLPPTLHVLLIESESQTMFGHSLTYDLFLTKYLECASIPICENDLCTTVVSMINRTTMQWNKWRGEFGLQLARQRASVTA